MLYMRVSILSPTLMGTSSEIQLAEGWYYMVWNDQWPCTKSNQRHLLWLLWRQGRRCSILNWWCFAADLHSIIVRCLFHLFRPSHHWRSGHCGPSAIWQELRSWFTIDSNTLVRHRCSPAFFNWTFQSFTNNRLRPSRFQEVDLDPSDVRSYRPITNLLVLLKLLERIVARQPLAHLTSNGLLSRFQSVYLAHHSKETAVSK